MIEINQLLTSYNQTSNGTAATNLVFQGVGDKDVYNITAPFCLDGQMIIAGRIEAREDEQSEIGFFHEVRPNTWALLPEAVTLALQDPFVTVIDGGIVIGGVEVFFEENGARWRTLLFKLNGLNDCQPFFAGPWGMKDLRLKQLKDGRILVLTRPQGAKGGRGKIGATILPSLDALTIEKINAAPLLHNQFNDEEWGGANEIHALDQQIVVLGHIAKFDAHGQRHYYAMTFVLDETFTTMQQPKIIAQRADFLPGPTKREDLEDVVFSGGIVINDEKAVLYAGISDAGAQKIEIENPFR